MSDLPDWLAPLDALGREAIAGDDSAGVKLYDQPAFEELEAEIKKPQAMKPEPVDWSRVDALARPLLGETSKDLRVMGFLAASILERHKGARGPASAAVLLASVAETFGSKVWPRRKRAAAGALDWVGERIVESADALVAQASDLETLELAAAKARAAHVAFEAAYTEDPIEPLRHLRKWADLLDARVRQAQSKAQSAAATPAASSAGTAGGGSASAPQLVDSPESAKALLTNTKKSFLKAAGVLRGADVTDPTAYRLQRFGLWPDRLAFEVGAGGATPIPMLDAATMAAQLEKFQGERDEGVLARIEAAFAERPFWLDLQRVLAQTMESFGSRFDAARGVVLGETIALTQRIPALLEANFASGSPFADAATQAWLGSASGAGVEAAAVATGGGEQDSLVADAESEARAALAKGDLRSAVATYQAALSGPADPRARFQLRLGLARTCQSQGHAGLALPHLAELREDLARVTVGEWAPDLAIEVLATTVEALRAEAKGKGAGAQAAATQAADALSELSRLDPLRALSLST